MPLLNYTTTIEASKTVSEIQTMLAKHGARAVLIEYDKQGFVEALFFKVPIFEILPILKEAR